MWKSQTSMMSHLQRIVSVLGEVRGVQLTPKPALLVRGQSHPALYRSLELSWISTHVSGAPELRHWAQAEEKHRARLTAPFTHTPAVPVVHRNLQQRRSATTVSEVGLAGGEGRAAGTAGGRGWAQRSKPHLLCKPTRGKPAAGWDESSPRLI